MIKKYQVTKIICLNKEKCMGKLKLNRMQVNLSRNHQVSIFLQSATTLTKTGVPISDYRPESRNYGDKYSNMSGPGRNVYGDYEDENARLARKLQEEYDNQADEDYLAHYQAKDYKNRASREQEDARVAREIQEQLDRELAHQAQNQGSSPENTQQQARSGVRRRTGQNFLNYQNPEEDNRAGNHPVFNETAGYGGFGGAGRQPSRQGHESGGYRQQNPYTATPAYQKRPSSSQYQQYPTSPILPDTQLDDDELLQQAILESMKPTGHGRAR